jgi:hypothetical protein
MKKCEFVKMKRSALDKSLEGSLFIGALITRAVKVFFQSLKQMPAKRAGMSLKLKIGLR